MKSENITNVELEDVIGGRMEASSIGYGVPGSGRWPTMKWSFNFKRWFKL